ncbi:Fe-S cluster domain-containing protein [candidate division KSB1 bacterium]|nr:Fe-S cluster domain-containing protein [candidate division KSB1 bacterium]RQW00841.1 MAG: Fe-S cluster domain-containing protein [candidate division KSB1 bacterium]
MDPVFLSSILTLGGLGLLFGAGLAYAAKKFAVYVDPKVEQIIEALPGANCGACGKPGCSAYAEAVVKGETPPNMCSPGGADVTEKIARILGVKAEATEPKVAVVQCQGGRAEAVEKYAYEGVQDCSAAELIGGGSKACSYGCLGLGSCVKACPFDAMYMSDNGLPVVFEEKCTACNICVTTCPRGIMALIPRSQKVYLACVSQDKAKAVKSVCTVGCFACKICVMPKVTPDGSIEMNENLPVIKNIHSDNLYTAYDKCPSKSYVIRIPRPEPEIVEDTVSAESQS